MQEIPIFEAKNKLTQFIREVENGEPIELMRHNKSVAVLISKNDYDVLQNGNYFAHAYNEFRKKFVSFYESGESANIGKVFENLRDRNYSTGEG